TRAIPTTVSTATPHPARPASGSCSSSTSTCRDPIRYPGRVPRSMSTITVHVCVPATRAGSPTWAAITAPGTSGTAWAGTGQVTGRMPVRSATSSGSIVTSTANPGWTGPIGDEPSGGEPGVVHLLDTLPPARHRLPLSRKRSGFVGAAQNCLGAAVGVVVGSVPAADADAHRGPLVPFCGTTPA